MPRYDITTTEDIDDTIQCTLAKLIDAFFDKDKSFEFVYSNRHYYDSPQGIPCHFTISAHVSKNRNLPCKIMRKKKSLKVDNIKIAEIIGCDGDECIIGQRRKNKISKNELLNNIYEQYVAPRIQYTFPRIMNSFEYNIREMNEQITSNQNVTENQNTLNRLNQYCDGCTDKLMCALKNGKISRSR